jgi:hypothetical protein
MKIVVTAPDLGSFEIGVDDESGVAGPAEEMAFRRVGALTAQILEIARQFHTTPLFTVQVLP